jgi:hypothetical protein
MRYLLLVALALLTAVANAAEPSYTCDSQRGCREEPGPTHDIGRGAVITLPDGWTYFTYPMPPMAEGLREVRAFKGGLLIAISPFPNIDRRDISEQWVQDIAVKSGAQYVAQSKEQAVNFVSISHDDVVGGFIAFTAKNDGEKVFSVLANRKHSSLTSFVISYKFAIFSVSVLSEHGPDEGYLAAVDAIRKIK